VIEADQALWGRVEPGALERILVLSPHFDDAAMGAGLLLLRHAGGAEATVVTVFGGRPPAYPTEPSEWDALGGFRAGDDVVALRREEDRAAMAVLGAEPVWLDFADHQYLEPAERPTPEEVAPAIARVVAERGPTAVLAPMGLANPDHVVTHDAALLVRHDHPDVAWFCYEDQGYKHLPGLLAWRVAKLFRSLVWPTPAAVPVASGSEAWDRKRDAIWCYASQIPPLERDHGLTERMAAAVPEQFWRLLPPPPGWEALVDV
jgi:LmbE family N-acetylglucosaminyl deacetylase